ncbi:MAG TPA: ion channel [Byssovorax sp.]|jgi:inward rectifier potassium channel
MAHGPPPVHVERIGLKGSRWGDLYHFLLLTPWWRFFGLIALAYLAANALFAGLYVVVPGSLESARPGSFLDAFFFSVQTMATIGYGKMLPATVYANALVTIESLLGIFGVALVTGLTFAKFARPTARVLFSKVAVVSTRDGVRSLMIRMANERASQIVDVNLFMVLALNDVTPEGESLRRFHTLTLSRSRAATFALTFTAVHAIDAASPLATLAEADLHGRRAEIIAIVTGIDETFAQTVHARMNYTSTQILFDRRFVDVVKQLDATRRVLDYGRFHDTSPAK